MEHDDFFYGQVDDEELFAKTPGEYFDYYNYGGEATTITLYKWYREDFPGLSESAVLDFLGDTLESYICPNDPIEDTLGDDILDIIDEFTKNFNKAFKPWSCAPDMSVGYVFALVKTKGQQSWELIKEEKKDD